MADETAPAPAAKPARKPAPTKPLIARASHAAQTQRLQVYNDLIKALLPRIGAAGRAIGARPIDVDADVESARNLALVAIFADMRRIASENV